jgi:nucleoside 2-deoxyribosyltransferase
MSMRPFKVYLAGPITGLSYGGATDWRKLAKEALADLSHGRIEGYSPMRAKEYLADIGLATDGGLSALGYEGKPLSSQRGIMMRDYNDVKTADAVFLNMMGAKIISVGTVIEAAWTFPHVKPTVALIEADGSNIHEHVMFNEATPVRTENFDEAMHLLVKILLP